MIVSKLLLKKQIKATIFYLMCKKFSNLNRITKKKLKNVLNKYKSCLNYYYAFIKLNKLRVFEFYYWPLNLKIAISSNIKPGMPTFFWKISFRFLKLHNLGSFFTSKQSLRLKSVLSSITTLKRYSKATFRVLLKKIDGDKKKLSLW